MRACPRFVTAGAAVEAVGQRGLTSKTQIEVIVRCFNWLVWLLAALNLLEDQEVRHRRQNSSIATLNSG